MMKYWLALLLFIGTISVNAQDEGILVFERIYDLAWSPDGMTLAVSGGSEICDETEGTYGTYILDADSLETLQLLQEPRCPVDGIVWSSDSTLLVTGGLDGFSRVWDATTGEVINVSGPRGYGVSTVELTISPDDERIAELRSETTIYLWETFVSETVSQFDSDEYITAISWHPENDLLAMGIFNGIQLLNTTSMTISQTMHTSIPAGSIIDVAWNSEGTKIAGISVEGSVHIFDIATEIETQLFITSDEQGSGIAWNQDNGLIAASLTKPDESSSGIIRIWDLETHHEIQQFEAPFPSGVVDWHPDGERIAFTGYFPDTRFLRFQIMTLSSEDQ